MPLGVRPLNFARWFEFPAFFAFWRQVKVDHESFKFQTFESFGAKFEFPAFQKILAPNLSFPPLKILAPNLNFPRLFHKFRAFKIWRQIFISRLFTFSRQFQKGVTNVELFTYSTSKFWRQIWISRVWKFWRQIWIPRFKNFGANFKYIFTCRFQISEIWRQIWISPAILHFGANLKKKRAAILELFKFQHLNKKKAPNLNFPPLENKKKSAPISNTLQTLKAWGKGWAREIWAWQSENVMADKIWKQKS